MPARRRFIADIAPERSAFARSVLLESWRAVLPDTFDLALPLSLRDRVRLGGSERMVVSDALTATEPGVVAAGALDCLWIDHAAGAAAFPSTPRGLGVTISAAVDLGVGTEDLAAAVTAVAGERGASSISVFRLDERDSAPSRELVRAVRRMSSIPVELVVHDISTDITVQRFTDCHLVLTADRTAERVARAAGVPTVRLGSQDDLAELSVGLHAPRVGLDPAELRAARAIAFALDAWQRHRLTTDEARAAVRPVAVDEDRVAA